MTRMHRSRLKKMNEMHLMKMQGKTSTLAVAAMLAIAAATGCKRERPGCTDTLSHTYDPKATIDDGSCTYAADLWAGAYATSDTLHESNGTGGYDAVVVENVILVRRLADNRVAIDGFLGQLYMAGRVTATRFSWEDDGIGDLHGLDCTRQGDTISYALPDRGGGAPQDRGRAVRGK
jgi:hypothetical protein